MTALNVTVITDDKDKTAYTLLEHIKRQTADLIELAYKCESNVDSLLNIANTLAGHVRYVKTCLVKEV